MGIEEMKSYLGDISPQIQENYKKAKDKAMNTEEESIFHSQEAFAEGYTDKILPNGEKSISLQDFNNMALEQGWIEDNQDLQTISRLGNYFNSDKDPLNITASELDKSLREIYTIANSTQEAMQADEVKETKETKETKGTVATANEKMDNGTKTSDVKNNKTNDYGQTLVDVKPWGTGEDDCLSRIIQKYVPEIKMYSSDYNSYLTKVCQDNGIEDPDVVHTGQQITLPMMHKDADGNIMRDEKNNIKFYSEDELKSLAK